MKFTKTLLILAVVIVVTIVGDKTRVFAQDPPPIDILIVEVVGMSDSDDADPPTDIDLSDTVVATDDVSVGLPVEILVTESVGVSDFVGVVPPLEITVTEQILITDSGGVVNASPIVEAGPDMSVDEGTAAVLFASVIVLDPQLTTATVDWGDGSVGEQIIPTTGGAISGTHLYSTDDVFTVSVTATGLFGDEITDTAQIEVINLAPIVELGVPYTLDLADPISTAVLTAVASDPGGDPLTYGWDLDGDGQFDDGTGQGALFAPTDLGVFAPSVEVQDDAGATTVQSYLVTVVNTGSATNPPDDATIPPADDSDPPSDSDPAETGKYPAGQS